MKEQYITFLILSSISVSVRRLCICVSVSETQNELAVSNTIVFFKNIAVSREILLLFVS